MNLLDDFKVAGFPFAGDEEALTGGFVYVLCFAGKGPSERPFYVGQTDRFHGRMSDYRLASFAACTDFCVGEATRYLIGARDFRVTVRYRVSDKPRIEEKQIIRDLLISGNRLLNCLPRYDYRTARESEERDAIHRFCDLIASDIS